MIEKSWDGIVLVSRDGMPVYASPSNSRILGYAPEQFDPDDLWSLVHPDDLVHLRAEFRGLLGRPGGNATAEFRARHRNGRWLWMEGTATNLVDDPAVRAVVCNYRDVSERKRAEKALRASEERYALAARGASDGLWDWDLATNKIYFSPRWKAMIGYGEDEIGDSPNEWFVRVNADDLKRLEETIARHIEEATPHFEAEYRLLHKDGSFRWMLARGLAVRGETGTAHRMAGSQSDVTERRDAEERLVHHAFYDPLTKLPNRELFAERLWRAVERAKRRDDYRFALLFLDLDRFKVVNDGLGHQTGDRLLASIAGRLARCLKSSDTLARLGGDEFGVLLDFIESVSDARRVAERLQEALGRPFHVDGHEIVTSASVGIVISDEHHEHQDELMREADIAMYRAKAAGKGRYVIYDAKLHEHVMHLMRIEADLRGAVARRELSVRYQPIVRLSTNRIAGFEALVRWNHPERGDIPPSDFIPVAEETHLVLPIDRWVLYEACRQLREWQDRFPRERLSVNVNFSGRQFAEPDTVDTILRILTETGVEPGSLRIEITEHVLLERPEAVARTLARLRANGVRVVLDDFGTGYSSLSYLHRFPIDALKIDRSFIERMGNSEGKNMEIVRAIAAMAEGLGIDAIAEGVESADHALALASLRCAYAQGYLFSPPVDADAAGRLVEAGISSQ